MTVYMVQERGKVVCLFSVQPEALAFDLYGILVSFVAANMLWIYTIIYCLNLANLSVVETVNRLIMIQISFAIMTALLWAGIYQQKGRRVTTHVIFYIWFGAKFMTAILEIIFFPKLYRKIFHQTSEDLNPIIFNLIWAMVVVLVIEGIGLFYAKKHFKNLRNRKKSPATVKAHMGNTFNV